MLQFDEIKHEYTLDGRKLPSVTQVLAPLFCEVAATANPLVRDAAAKRGSRVHEATALWDYDGDITDDLIDYETSPYIQAYIDWKRDYQPKTLRIEYPTTNGYYAGTIDRVAEIDGSVCVIDIKTGTPDIRAVSAQCYAYANLLSVEGIFAEQLYVLQLKKDGKYSFRKLDRNRGETFWNACFGLHVLIREDKERNKK